MHDVSGAASAAASTAESSRRRVLTSTEYAGDSPTVDIAVSQALLERASQGLEAETLRLYRPAPMVAFSPLDREHPGYRRARAAARAAGFAPVERLGGGHAAVFHPGTIAFAWTIPEDRPRLAIHERFQALAELMAHALRSLGVDARIGQVAGEYCPGAYSVNARGRTKLMGVAQRLAPHASHVGGVVVVNGAQPIRDVLHPVYDVLGLAWDPDATGAVEDEIGPVRPEEVMRAIFDAFATRFDIEPRALSAESIARAREIDVQTASDAALLDQHDPHDAPAAFA